MHYYLLHTEIRDCNNEYDEFIVIKTDENKDKINLFEKFVYGYYGERAQKNGNDSYQLLHDYRIITFVSIKKISEWMIKKLHDYGIAYSITL